MRQGNQLQPTQVRPMKSQRRPVSIEQLLHWAFARECASIDFDEIGTETGARNYGMEYVMIERARIGCRVDGGGRSEPHPDADIVASAVSALPEAYGGRPMAVRIAELARAGRTPDWAYNPPPQIIPCATSTNQHGTRAAIADAAALGEQGWRAQPRLTPKGVRVWDAVHYCPVRILHDPATVSARAARQRRDYLQWWGALLELRQTFKIYGGLSAFDVTDQMPPRKPWEKTS